MYAFLLLCVPCVALFLLLTDTEYRLKSFIPPMVAGLIVAIAACVIRGFFITYTHQWSDSPARTFAFLILRDTLVPTAVLYGLFLLFSRDSREYKARAFLPLMGAFYAVYMPYFVLSGSGFGRFLPFMLFVKPLLVTAYVILETVVLRLMVSCGGQKKPLLLVLYAVLALVLTALPPLAETLWFYDLPPVLYLLLSALMLAACAALSPRIRRKEPEPSA